MKTFGVLAMLILVSWLWMSGTLSEWCHSLGSGDSVYTRMKHSEALPMSNSGAVGSVRNVGQGVSGSYGRTDSMR